MIKNFKSLASSPERKKVLEIVEAGLKAIQPKVIFAKNFLLKGDKLSIKGAIFNLKNFEKIFLIGFGKGSAEMAKIVEEVLGPRLAEGYVIDWVPASTGFSKINLTLGSHPLPSETNLNFTREVIRRLSNPNPKTLILVIIAGGGSALFTQPQGISLQDKIKANQWLLKSGADIGEVNTVRKHLSLVKGGGLAKILYPATIVSLIFSDVPGNDLSVIASGPTVKDPTTIENAQRVLAKYGFRERFFSLENAFAETPKEDKYFEKVFNLLFLSNLTALEAMAAKAKTLGLKAFIYSDRVRGEARQVGQELVKKAKAGQILLAAGETTVKVLGPGQGGRNQEIVLGALASLAKGVTICAINSDGWDNTPFAGAIGDDLTLQKAKKLSLVPETFLRKNDSYDFFEKTGDGILTGRLIANIADLMIILKK